MERDQRQPPRFNSCRLSWQHPRLSLYNQLPKLSSIVGAFEADHKLIGLDIVLELTSRCEDLAKADAARAFWLRSKLQ